MKRTVPLTLVLLLGLCSCTTPVSQLRVPEESSTDISSGVLVEEISEESNESIEEISDYFPPMIAFGAAIMDRDGLTGSLEDPESDFFEENGFTSGAGSSNTFRLNEAGQIQPEHLIVSTVAGQKNLVMFACQGIGTVRVAAEKDGQVVAEDSLRCSIPAAELKMEFIVPQGGDLWITQEPSADTRGIHEVMFYG